MTKKILLEQLVEVIVEQELNVLNTPVIYFDMDGVLADFDHGVEAGNVDAEKARVAYMSVLKNFPEMMSLTDDQIKARLAGKQEDPGLKALKKAWQRYRELKFMVAGRPGFFLSLPEMPGAREMLVRAAALTGRKPSILTAPMDTEHCEKEKEQWMQQHFGGLYDGFHCTQNKAGFANPNAILIDDRTKYTDKFQAAGGIAILHKNPADTLQKLENLLKQKGLPV